MIAENRKVRRSRQKRPYPLSPVPYPFHLKHHMRRSFCRHGAIGEGDGGLQHGQVAFAFDFCAADEDGLTDFYGLSETALHLSCVGRDAFLEEEVVPHDLIHKGHDEAAVHAVVVALMLLLRCEDG